MGTIAGGTSTPISMSAFAIDKVEDLSVDLHMLLKVHQKIMF